MSAVDAQRDFMLPDGALYVADAETLVEPINRWLERLDPSATAGVILTFDTHEGDTYPFIAEAAQFPLHCVRGSRGWQSAINSDAIPQAIPLYTLEKGVFAMWDEPDVIVSNARNTAAPAIPRDRFFDDLRRSGVGDATVVGVAADFCVRWAVEGLLTRDFKVDVLAALTRGIVRQIEGVSMYKWAGRDVSVT